MSVTLECTVKVGIRPLRQAITAVVPHAEPTKNGDEISSLSRVRFVAAKTELLVMATCTHTSALAAVPIDEDSRAERFAADDGVFSVDMTPGILRSVLADFKGSRSAADGINEWVELDFGNHDTAGREVVRITDVSALLPGLSMTIPVTPLASEFPDLVGVLSRAVGNAAGDAKPLVSAGAQLSLFRHASETYGQPLQFEPTGTKDSRGYIVLCGAYFSGHITSRHNDDDSLKRRDAERRKHLERLGLSTPLASVG